MMKNKGMTLFIAVVVMSILLFISFAVVNIAIKSNLFAGSGRDSQYAFYAADAGLECAFYWDSQFDAFATSTSGSPINCGGSIMTNNDNISGTTSVATLIGGGTDADQTSKFGFVLNQGSNPTNCAIVTVTKYYVDTTGDGNLDAPLMTKIKSRGYNTCDLTHPRRVERGIEVTY